MFSLSGSLFPAGLAVAETSISLDTARALGSTLRIETGGHGIHFNRSKNFKIANTGEWGDVVLRGQPGQEDPLSFDLDDNGGGYEVTVTLPGENWDYGLSFSQSFAADQQVKDQLPAVGAGHLTNMAFIDGKAHATGQTFGYFISASPIAGQTRPSTLKLDYRLNYYDISFFGTYHWLQKKRFRFDLLGGPSFSRFSQDFRVNSWGINAVTGGPTSSSVKEELKENLFGGYFGFQGNLKLCKKLFFSFKQLFGGFLNSGKLNASQDIVHGSGNAGGGVTFSNLNERITVRDSDCRFTSRFSSLVALDYTMTKRTTLSFFYRFDQWLRLSSVENPVVSADLRTVHNGCPVACCRSRSWRRENSVFQPRKP